MKPTGSQGNNLSTGNNQSGKQEETGNRSLTGSTSADMDKQRLQTIEGKEQASAETRGEEMQRDEQRPDPGTVATAAFDKDTEPRLGEGNSGLTDGSR